MAGNDDRCPAARPAQHAEPDTKSHGHIPGNGVDCHDRLGQEGFVGEDRGDRVRIEGSRAGM